MMSQEAIALSEQLQFNKDEPELSDNDMVEILVLTEASPTFASAGLPF